jgi:hypothetical protein
LNLEQGQENEVTFAKHPIKQEEAIYVEDIKAVEEKPEQLQSSPVLAGSPEIHTEHPSKWKGAMFLASVCAVATSAGIRGYIRG